jgi:hypothetical protein
MVCFFKGTSTCPSDGDAQLLISNLAWLRLHWASSVSSSSVKVSNPGTIGLRRFFRHHGVEEIGCVSPPILIVVFRQQFCDVSEHRIFNSKRSFWESHFPQYRHLLVRSARALPHQLRHRCGH